MNLRWEILRRHPGSRKLYRHVAYDFICCVRNSVTNYHAIALNIAQCQLYLLAYLLTYLCTIIPKLKLHHFDVYEFHGQRVVLQAVQMSRCRGFGVGLCIVSSTCCTTCYGFAVQTSIGCTTRARKKIKAYNKFAVSRRCTACCTTTSRQQIVVLKLGL